MAENQGSSDIRGTQTPPLTVGAVKKARPRADRDYEIADGLARGLRLRVTKLGRDGVSGGAKIFRWYVNGARPRRVITIGRWAEREIDGHVTLEQAHLWLRQLKAAHRAGKLDAKVKEMEGEIHPRPAPAAAEPGAVTFRQVADDFLAHIKARRKRPGEVERTLTQDLLPALGDRAIATITPREIRQVVEAVVARGSPTQAGKVLAHAKQLFKFACGRDEIAVAANPAYPLEADALGVVKNKCARFLNKEEIPALWSALGKAGLSATVRVGLKLILLTGVRTCELLRAKWTDVDLDSETPAWTVPVSSQKLTRKQEANARPWIVPLSPEAVALFRQLHALADGSPWVMASPRTDPDEPPAPLSEKALVAGMRKLFVGKKPSLNFPGERPTPHDLRRTMRTHLGGLGVPRDIAERCLNHVIGEMDSIYDQGDYLDQRRAALVKWAAFVDKLNAPVASKVSFLPARGTP